MEAATPLRKAHVRTLGESVVVDGLTITDPAAVALVRTREDAGEDPATVVADAIEIGARVMDREQTGANTDLVKAEFEKASEEVQRAFGEKATAAAESLQTQLEEVFGPENGHLARALERLFSDGSSEAVQHRVREIVAEVMAKSREDLLRQFSASDGRNPLADFKSGTIQALDRATKAQDGHMRAVLERMASMQREIQGLRDEREKHDAVAEAEAAGTRKGRTFEDLVGDALDRLAAAQGDSCDAVGDVSGGTGRKGDLLVGIDGCHGPARGRIVFEAKDSRLSKPKAIEELDGALANRDADFAVLVVRAEDRTPAGLLPLREFNGDKMVVVYNPDEDSDLALQVGYALARARVLMSRGGADDLDPAAIRDRTERALNSLAEFKAVKSKLTSAKSSIDGAAGALGVIEDAVRAQLEQIAALLAAADEPAV